MTTSRDPRTFREPVVTRPLAFSLDPAQARRLSSDAPPVSANATLSPPNPWLMGAGISRSTAQLAQAGLYPPYQIDIGTRPGMQHPPIPSSFDGIPVRTFVGSVESVIVEPIDPTKPVV